jgi:hypothetical protein
MGLYAELQLELLRPEPPERLLTEAGDMDNRLKTLFDALTMPRHADALPKNIQPESDETPFFCPPWACPQRRPNHIPQDLLRLNRLNWGTAQST